MSKTRQQAPEPRTKNFTILSFLDHQSTKLAVVMVIVFSILYAILSVVRHMHFQSGAFDLGIFDQAVWQYAHAIFPYNTIKEKFILGDHLSLTLPLLAPLFWIWDDVRMLLIFQAVWVSVSSLGIYLYLQKRGFTQLQSLMLSFVYLLFYGMQYLVFFDFHSVVIAVGLMPWILYFWESARWKLFTISTILLLLTQENMGLALFALCLIWFFQRKRLKLVFLLALVGLVWTGIAFYLIHIFSNGHLQYVPDFPHDPSGFVTRFFDTEDKRQVWLFSYSWFSFLPLLSPGSLLAVASDLSQYFITGPAFSHMWTPYFHHRAILSVYLLAGTADVLLFLKKRKFPITVLVSILLIVSVGLQFYFHFALNKLVKKDYWQQDTWIADNNEMLKHVHPTASVASQQSLVPHLSHRKNIYLAYPRQHSFKTTSLRCTKQCWWLDFVGNPQLLVVDTHDNEWETMTLEQINNFRSAIANMEQTGVIKLSYQKGEAKIYRVDNKKIAVLMRQ